MGRMDEYDGIERKALFGEGKPTVQPTMKLGKPQPAFTEPKRRMTDAQRDKLWDLCGRYNVPFREDDYYLEKGSDFALGWVGGINHSAGMGSAQTIYICVEPNGDSHS